MSLEARRPIGHSPLGYADPMHPIAIIAAALAGLVHAYFFLLESVWFMRPEVFRRFGLKSVADASVARSWAFNQGFYNLFLAIGVLVGITLVATGETAPGRAIIFFACGSMVAAGGVLVARNPAYVRAALTQAGPPAVAILSAWALT